MGDNNENSKTVLLVDDAPSNIQAVNSILKDTYKTRIATNGARALELVKVTPPPDLVLLDVSMPGMDGYEVCTRLKADPQTRDIPVIFLTGQTEIEEETHGFDVGAVDYIHKPFSPAVVKARVQTHLTLRGVRQQLASQLRVIQKELEGAREIQQSILPESVPEIVGLDIAARYLPMTSVAGDYYDFIVLDDKRVGILVADVSGHGMPAALIASMLKIALSMQVDHADSPAKLLHGLNQALCGKFQQQYVTAAYAFFDMVKGTVTYAGAGHPPFLLWSTSAANIRPIEQNGLFLGRFDFASYRSLEVPLAPGDWGLLYTDGIPETTNAAQVEFGAERFRQFLASQRATSADDFVNELLVELSRWSSRTQGEDLNDDITAVAIHVKDTR